MNPTVPEMLPPRLLRYVADDHAEAALAIVAPEHPREALFFLPAMGVGIKPNLPLAQALAGQGTAVAVMEWRGLGSSNRRADRHCDWNYADVLERDIPAALAVARDALPGMSWSIGGHSIGGQFALLAASGRPADFQRVLPVASGHPHWRGFARPWQVRAFALAVPAITLVAGHFPGRRFGFAGREARGLMRDWAASARSGDYLVAGFGPRLHDQLQAFTGAVHAVAMRHDWLAPQASLQHLRRFVPHSRWHEATLDNTDFHGARADHFSWLKQPGPVLRAWARLAGEGT